MEELFKVALEKAAKNTPNIAPTTSILKEILDVDDKKLAEMLAKKKRTLYNAYIEVGFSEDQAFDLILN